jgi:hypothetical protein
VSDDQSEILDSQRPSGVPDAYDVLPAGSPEAMSSTPKRGRLLAIGAAVVAVAVVATAGVAVGLSLSGGGAQPEDLVPANAVAYVDVDLDPSASQKLDAVRFFRHFPSADAALGAGDDMRQFIAKAFTDSSVDYAADIEPWLGRRYGLAVIPGAAGGRPVVEAVLQVSDDAAARQHLPKVLPNGADFALADGFVVITSGPASAASIVAQAHASSLADSSAFTDALAPYGDGVASFYLDMPALTRLMRQALPGAAGGLGNPFGSQQLTGVLAGVVKFQPDAVEVLAGAPTQEAPPASTMVQSLPGTTVAAVGISGYGDAVKQQWRQFLQQMSGIGGGDPGHVQAQLERQTGMKLPDDLIALLGSQLSLSVDSEGLASYPLVGYQAATDPAAAAPGIAAVTKLLRQAGVSVSSTSSANRIVLATTPGYGKTLVAANGDLGSTSSFQSAVPDAQGATDILYVDLATIFDLTGVASGRSGQDVAPLKSLGATVHVDNGHATYRLRVTVKGG